MRCRAEERDLLVLTALSPRTPYSPQEATDDVERHQKLSADAYKKLDSEVSAKVDAEDRAKKVRSV